MRETHEVGMTADGSIQEQNSYPHMCQDGHQRIAHSDSEHEMCPLCRALAALAQKTRECEELKDANSIYFDFHKISEMLAENERLKAQVEQLERQVAELSKPVTVQELKKHGCQGLAAVASVAAVNCVIAARAAQSVTNQLQTLENPRQP